MPLASVDLAPAAPAAGPIAAPVFASHVERVLARAVTGPDEPVLVEGDCTLTARRFAQMVHRTADDLAGAGMGPGQTVALAAPISADAVIARYAAGLLGCATVLCPHADEPERLAAFLRAVEADVLVCFPPTRAGARAAGQAPRVQNVLFLQPTDRDDSDGDTAGGDTAASDAAPTSTRRPGLRADDTAVLVSSGGTTGGAKASVRTAEQWLAMVDTGPMPGRRQLICTPLPYIAQVHLDQTLLGGGTAVLLPRFDPADVLAAIAAERITHLGLVEPLLAELAAHPDVAGTDLSRLVSLSHIGADAARSLRRRILKRLGQVLAHPYGASEAGIVSMLTPPAYSRDRLELLDSAGSLLPGVEVRIAVPADGSSDGSGRIQVRSPAVARQFRASTQYGPFTEDGWYDTGDIGTFDGGWLRVRGRAADAVDTGRGTAFPVDLQEIMCAHPDVAYAVAVVLPSAQSPIPGGPTASFGVAVVLERDMRTGADELLAYARRLGPCLPIAALAVVDRVPVTEQGKPDRAALLGMLGGR